jgi:hypothetical protein
MGYDIKLIPTEEEVEKIKKDNEYCLNNIFYSDKSIYYEFLITLYHVKYVESESNNLHFNFKPYYNYFLSMLKLLYSNSKTEAIKNFITLYEKNGYVNYSGWDKQNSEFIEEDNFIEGKLDYLIKEIYCTEWTSNDKFNFIEDFLNVFLDDVYQNQVYYFINQFKHCSEENY